MLIGPAVAVSAWRRRAAAQVDYAAPAPNTLVTLANIGVAESGAGTYLFVGTAAATATGTAQSIIQVDAGASTNRYLASLAAGSALTQLTRTTAGAGSSVNGGAVTAGVEFAYGLAIDGAGNVEASLNGDATTSRTGGPTAGLTTLRIGAGGSGGALFGGTIARVRVLPGQVLAGAALQAAVAAYAA